MHTTHSSIRSVLFDLDGTLLDTASDLGAALNELRAQHGLESLPQSSIRPYVSKGTAALVEIGLGAASPVEQDARIKRFLALYRDRLADETRPFDEVPELLNALEQRGILWGIVTNKVAWLAEPLLAALGLASRARVIVCGDTLAERKPSPIPLLYAAQRMSVLAAECLFLGDAQCDMQAAHAAGMIAIGARFGYVADADMPESWPAHAWIDSPIELLDWI